MSRPIANVGSDNLTKRAHEHDDVNLNLHAHHHTLGPGPFQAAPGNHSHPIASGPMLNWTSISAGDVNLTTSTSVAITPALTIPVVSTSDKFLVIATADVRTTAANVQNFIGEMQIDSTLLVGSLIANSGSTSGWRATVEQQWTITGLSPGDHTFTLLGRTSAASGGTWVAVQTHTRFNVTKLEAFGPQGVKGPKGDKGDKGDAGSGGAGTLGYVHTQGALATTWTITHGLGFYPNVTCIDTAGDQIEGDIVYSPTTVSVLFSSAQSGIAYLS